VIGRSSRQSAALVVLAVAALAGPAAKAEREAAEAPSSPVLLAGPGDARLLVQIRRELAASGFPVIERSGALEGHFPIGVAAAVVVESDRRVRVWIPDHTGGPPRLRADLTVDRSDPHARRRACLAVVEYLRFGAPEEPPPVPVPVPAPLSLRPPGSEALALDLAMPEPGPPRRPWGLGAATTVNADSGIGEPTSHVQLMAQLPLSERWSITVTGLWPLLGAQFQTDQQYVRMWTMALAGGLRLALPRPLPRLRPFAGLALGTRFVLADSEWMETRQSRVVVTPSATVGASAGFLIELRPLIHLLLEGTVQWMGRLPVGSPTRYEAAAARGRAAHAAAGVLFEY
jgi:hypothetical protein